jgi:transcriptional antiterminator NusG
MCGISTGKGFAGKVGDRVRIVSGTFAHQEGIIDFIDNEKGILRVLIYAFGRATPAELNFNEVTLI